MDTPLLLAAVPALIALNAFFVASEYALVATRPVHLDALRKVGRRRTADALAALKARTADALGTIQVCITVTNLALGWLGEPAMTGVLNALLGRFADAIPDALFRPLSIGLSFLVVTLLTVVFSELLPKALSLRFVTLAATLTAVPVRLISALVWPLVALMNGMANLVTRPLGLGRIQDLEHEGVSADELRLLTLEAAREGVLTPSERHLIVSTLTLNTRLARQIMVPRTQVVYLDLRRSMEENRRVMNERLFSRLPLCDGGLDRVLGVVHTKRFLAAYHAEGDVSVLQLIADEAVFVPDSISLAGVIATFSEKHTEFVILADEYGGAAGIVTLKDVIDELLGVVDESRALMADALKGGPDTPKAGSSHSRVVRGDLPVHELARLLERPDWGHGASAATVAGLIQTRLGAIGKVGDEVEVDGFRLKVLRTTPRAIRRVEVTPSSPEASADASG